MHFLAMTRQFPFHGRHWLVLICLGGLVGSFPALTVRAQDRVLGLDVSYWQGHIAQSDWNTAHSTGNREFVFIRSSRGGTTGVDQPQGTPGGGSLSTLSRRYDDPRFVQNITRATQAGLLAGAYHFSRPDIVTNTGTDEANHFLEMAGAWMRPGYLLPVHDLEAGDQIRSDNELAQFTLDFSDRIYEVMGIRPAIYLNGNYAHFVLGEADASLRDEIYEKHPTLWMARWPNQGDPDSIPVQTGHPSDSVSWTYGLWDNYGETHPWSFWQYASTVSIPGLSDSTVDGNVAQGGMEFLKDQLVPALWTSDSSGNWSTLANWNSGQTPQQPPIASGQYVPYATGPLPTPRLPGVDDAVNNIDGQNDTVILDRPSANITVTLSSGNHNIRKLFVRESLEITGGSLTVGYVPSADSTPESARFAAPVTLGDAASLSVHTLWVEAGQDFTVDGSLTFNHLDLGRDNSAPATLQIAGGVTFNPLSDAAAVIASTVGAGSLGQIDLGGEVRDWQVSNGFANIDLTVDVPVTNGSLSKSGAGTLKLTATTGYQGNVQVTQGKLILEDVSIDDSADVMLTAGATLELAFTGDPDQVNAFIVNGTPLGAGIWGGPGSGAERIHPTLAGTGTILVVAPLLEGDYNDDGLVNIADFAVWRDAVGAPAGTLENDESGVAIGQTQYDAWKANFGATMPKSAALATRAAVPEPPAATVVMLLAIVAGSWAAMRRVAGRLQGTGVAGD